MKIYDLMYSKDALNIYIYLFSSKKFNKEKENIIKNILYAIYMFSFYYEKTNTIEKFYQLFKKINYIEEIDNLLKKDANLHKIYELLPICKEISQEKNKYQLCLTELKHSILNANINDISYFIRIKNKLDETCEKMYNKTIYQEELNTLNKELNEKLQYLEQHIPATDIEAYKTYIKSKNNESSNFAIDMGIKLLEIQKGERTFSELKQLEELKDKTKSIKCLKINSLENLKLEKDECKQINIYAIKKIFKGVIEFFIFYFLIGNFSAICYKNFIDTNNIYMLLPFSIWVFIVILYIIYFSTYLVVILKNKKSSNIKGMIGIIANIDWSHGTNNKKFYNIYFPKHNLQYRIRTNCATNKLKIKSLVKFVKIATKKIVVPIEDNI